MQEIEITSNNYNPNLRILKNHIVTFNGLFIYLYSTEGNLLDSIKINYEKAIIDICIINNYYLIGFTVNDLFKINIKDEHLEIKDNILGKKKKNLNDNDYIFDEKILDAFYSEINKILVISYDNHIEIRDFNFLNQKPIQIIYKDNSFLLNMNKDLFITFDEDSFSLYEKITGTKYYQLLSKKVIPIKLNKNYIRLLKLDNKTLMVSNNENILFLINIKTMKIIEEIYFMAYAGEIDFINKIENNIYISKNNILLEFNYIKGQMTLINTKEQNNLFSLNYVNNLFIEKKYPKLYNKIKINCIENKIIPNNFCLIFKFILETLKKIQVQLHQIIFNLKDIQNSLSYTNGYKKETNITNNITTNNLLKNNNINELKLKKRVKRKKSELRTEKIIKRKIEIKKYKIIYPPNYFKKNYR